MPRVLKGRRRRRRISCGFLISRRREGKEYFKPNSLGSLHIVVFWQFCEGIGETAALLVLVIVQSGEQGEEQFLHRHLSVWQGVVVAIAGNKEKEKKKVRKPKKSQVLIVLTEAPVSSE